MDSNDQTPMKGRHRDPLLGSAEVVAAERRPQPGPITILPAEHDLFVDAVRSSGGTLVPLSDETRGLVWLAERDPEGLKRVLRQHPRIEWVQLPWAGVDAFAEVLQAWAGQSRPLWTSAKGAYSEPVAEHALALTLALLRQFPQKFGASNWAAERTGDTLFGANVVVVGAGGVAIEIIRMLGLFSARITVVRRSPGSVLGADRTVSADRLLDVLPDADVVIIAAAATNSTDRMFGARQFSAMRKTAYLVNIARGSLVDSDALAEALSAGTIAGAGLDVTDPEPLPAEHALWSEPRCVITSHSADTPEMTAPLLAERIRANVDAMLSSGRFVGIVDASLGY